MGEGNGALTTGRGRPTRVQGAPHGPQDVRDAVLRSAIVLFAEVGIGAVSVRQVADAAGVNAGLVHRYIGTKDDLVREVVQWASRNASRLDADGDTGAGTRLGPYERMLAHLSLEGYDLAELDLDFPLTRNLVSDMVAAGYPDREARLRAVCSLALSAWGLLAPLAVLAAELDEHDQASVDEALEQTRRWIAAAP